ncbi:hypothetical protein [Nocardia sp. NPDC050793]|uniref:hypothetical protein n=1 Tax=Nocardia sp. NPDC050793 TaxID=3155159 RepID=UPI003402B5C9
MNATPLVVRLAAEATDLATTSRLVAKLQDDTERLEQFSHLGRAYNDAYKRALYQLTAARTRLEQLKRGRS